MEDRRRIVPNWPLVLIALANLFLMAVIATRLHTTPADVYRELMQLEREIKYLQSQPPTVIAPKRWTATDMKLWQQDLFELNPMLKQPEFRPVLNE